MNLRKKIVLAIGALVAIIVIGGLLMENTFTVERQAVIPASPDLAYTYASDLTKHALWNARKARDDTMQFSFPEKKHAGEGAVYEWTSENSGAGTCRISRAETSHRLDFDITLKGKGTGHAFWIFEPEGQNTKLTRGFEGDIPVPILGSWLVLILNPAEQLGTDFDSEIAAFSRVLKTAAQN